MQTEKICQHELYLLFLPSTNQPDKDISALPLVLIKFSQVAKLQSKGFCSYSYRVAELGRWIVFSVTLHYLLTGIGTSFCQVFTCTTILPVHMYRYWHNYLTCSHGQVLAQLSYLFTCTGIGTTILPVHMYRYWHNYLAVVSATSSSRLCGKISSIS